MFPIQRAGHSPGQCTSWLTASKTTFGQEGIGIQARSLLMPGAGYRLSYTQMDPLSLSELVVQIVDLKPSFLGWEHAVKGTQPPV